ncbi:hypothetical protein ERO13_A12G156500v2 [Gossypium hirsutum]|uniref:Uncharacterized protein n=3 Tax=Gossypium TaxID=3633 RepID=A0A5J5TFF6_GOSBA|nr:hypothetical protein ES319_A12G165800v1 [Gossypium barbadense]KAG4170592.1 hypothetical protein ERO13_A12G156500v2 [Gossypium hirsutum]TYG90435.1 hypothetical protein ES288_A12G181700v1 [Gossypium darwinii]TYH96486.1 hypothetical protein ES332_A12G180800v1 [Gossypium tomentosum]
MLSIWEVPFNLGISFDLISTKQREESHGLFTRCAWRGGVICGTWHEWKNQLKAAVAEASKVRYLTFDRQFNI